MSCVFLCVQEKFGQDVEIVDGNESDGEYFETDCDGKVKLKKGKKKIDVNKLTKEDLEQLGIDPNASKEEIARALKVRHTHTLYCDVEYSA